MGKDVPFWKRKRLEQMSQAEWESLCDGCGRCCLFKLQDEDTQEVFYTNVVCRLLDTHTCRCTQYEERTRLVPTCLVVTPARSRELKWMPETCAYRLLAEGKDLPGWHPLVSGNANSVHRAGISVQGKTLSEDEVDMERLEDYIIQSDSIQSDTLQDDPPHAD
ncbi:MAG: YcgN family cysteine cluster protein [Anaerolineaceae bacterium]|nr:YcgN family cysteine cluster protein [Anaerolineaceae bacterium]